jgi:hypothetical protein
MPTLSCELSATIVSRRFYESQKSDSEFYVAAALVYRFTNTTNFYQ